MSRTTLCVLTAIGLAVLSAALMIGRCRILGHEARAPSGPRTWKVTLLVNGHSNGGNVRLRTALPLDFERQHIHNEAFSSTELVARPQDGKHPERRQVQWTPRPGFTQGHFRVHTEFFCDVDVHRPSSPMSRLGRHWYAPPPPGEFLRSEPLIECDKPEISALARDKTADLAESGDQLEALFQHVDREIGKEPSPGGLPTGALACLQNGAGDSAAKSRLLVALCRNRGIPARLVTGLHLVNASDLLAHVWVEVWLRDHWLPMCPFNHHYGRVPHTYLIFGFGDVPLVRGRNIRDLDYAFLVERTAPEAAEVAAEPWTAKRVLRQLSLSALPPAEQRLVEFLLLLPIAALIVCLYRNVIGLQSFGTFAPALVGMAFRELHSFPGIFVFVALVLLGWVMRRLLDRYHLLQVPRTAFMLSLVVVVLIGGIVAANFRDLPATRYITLFPLVILTGMIERFWT